MKLRRSSLLAAAAIFIAPHAHAASEEEALIKLAKVSGCLACHGLDKKIVGPGFSDIAARYRDTPDARAILIKSIRRGSRGKWRDVTGGLPMPANAPKVKHANIEKLADFVLSR